MRFGGVYVRRFIRILNYYGVWNFSSDVIKVKCFIISESAMD